MKSDNIPSVMIELKLKQQSISLRKYFFHNNLNRSYQHTTTSQI